MAPRRKIIIKDIRDNQLAFPCIPSLQLSALNINTYQKTVKTSGIRYISKLKSVTKYVSSSITHPNILLTYPMLIEVIHITAHINICIMSLIFGLTLSKSSIKLTIVVIAPNDHKR